VRPYLALSIPAVSLVLTLTGPARAATPCTIGAISALGVDGVTVVSASHPAPGQPGAATCTVFGTLNTDGAPAGSAVFQLRLPDTWSHKFIFFGVGGYGGTAIDPSANPTDIAAALARGYAAMITDTGHQGGSTDSSWALVRPGVPAAAKVADFLYRATHQVTQAGKALVQRFYGQPISRAYFDGCSNGGHQGTTEAADYPADYDGIIAGAPLFDEHVNLAALTFFRRQLASPQSYVPAAKLPAIEAAVLQSCDAADGVRDGLIQNPAACNFDPAVLICKGAETDSCLTPPQAQTVSTYLGETRDAAGGYLYTGWSISAFAGADIWTFGGTRPADFAAAEPWGNAGFAPAPIGWQFVDHLMKFLVEQKPTYDMRAFGSISSGAVSPADLALFDERLRVATVPHPDAGFNISADSYKAFFQRRGKLLLYHGLGDPAISPFSTMRLYEQMAAATPGGYQTLRRSARLFLVPDMQHCGRGTGPSVFDTLTPLEQWVEHGIPPSSIAAVHPAGKTIDRSMPLCPFPQQAAFSGKGDVKDAANWSCPDNTKMLSLGKNGRAAGL